MNFRMDLRSLLCAAISCCLFSVCAPVRAEIVDKVIVVVNDEVVTQREFGRAFSPIKKSYEDNFKGEELEKRLEAARKGLLEQLINSKLAVSLAKKEEIEIDEEALKGKIDKVKSYYVSEEAFLQTLSAKGTNLTEFEQEMREQMLGQKLVEKEVASKIVIAPGDIKDLYDRNKEQLVSPDTVKARGIMIRKGDVSAEAENRKKMEDIISELKKGKDFAALATERSEGPYASNGGDMGYVSPGQLLKEIDDVIFTLKKEELSDIVETRIGYHVFLVEEIQKPRQLELDEVSDFLREQLYMKRFEEGLVRWLDEKRKNAYISYK